MSQNHSKINIGFFRENPLLKVTAVLFLISYFWTQISFLDPILYFGDETIYYQVRDITEMFSLRFHEGHPPLFKSLTLILSRFGIIGTRITLVLINLLLFPIFVSLASKTLPKVESYLFAFNLFLSPIFFTHFNLIIPNFLLMIFIGLSLIFHFEEKPRLKFLMIFCALLTRESALAAVVAHFLIEKRKKKYWKYYAFFVLFLILHFVFQFILYEKWILNPGYKDFIQDNPLVWSHSFADQMKEAFLELLRSVLHFFSANFHLTLTFLLSYALFFRLIHARRKKIRHILGMTFLTAGVILFSYTPWAHLFSLFEFMEKGWLFYEHHHIWILISLFFVGCLSLTPEQYLPLLIQREDANLSDVRKEVITFTSVLMVLFLSFFTLYRDTYIRDILACTPFFGLSLYLSLSRFASRYLLIGLLLLGIYINFSTLLYPDPYTYPMNLYSK